jgi:hypothetical protein
MNLHDGGYPMQDDHVDPDDLELERARHRCVRIPPIWSDAQLSTKLHAIADGLQRQLSDWTDLCSEGLTLSEAEFADREELIGIIGALRIRARELGRNAVPGLVDRRFPIKSIVEHGVGESDSCQGYYVGLSGVTEIIPYIERGEAWLAVYQGDHICARVPAKAMIITYKEARNAPET